MLEKLQKISSRKADVGSEMNGEDSLLQLLEGGDDEVKRVYWAKIYNCTWKDVNSPFNSSQMSSASKNHHIL